MSNDYDEYDETYWHLNPLNRVIYDDNLGLEKVIICLKDERGYRKEKIIIDQTKNMIKFTSKCEDVRRSGVTLDPYMIRNLLHLANMWIFGKHHAGKGPILKVKLVYADKKQKVKLPAKLKYVSPEFVEFLTWVNRSLDRIMDRSLFLSLFPSLDCTRYLSVSLDGSDKTYYYTTDDPEIDVGTLVLVPVGENGNLLGGKVRAVNYYLRGEEPYPRSKVKKIADVSLIFI
ncbi:hypothetical protein [Lactobacillus corticis]|uniref:Uncharacterized protein n=1 Tax=Lactobacillus corticis TaxID=2201249 RepID=A0A916VGX4_9LACO|nr:hypothetical protein [Lactobacillus corticis]GFZ26431.1 hypothetical protein LCB40_03110 [Lactobacillus corticis]